MKRTFVHKVFAYLANKGCFNKINDERYLKLLYWARTGQCLNLNEPKSYNEKLQWLKLFDRNPLYSRMVDKYEAKKLVAEKIGEEFIIPTIGIWDSFEEIDFDVLPNQFVLKCTHDSGGLIICRDKKTLDIENARKKINRSMKRNYYFHGREWPYRNVKPRIIAEKYMVDESNKELKDYKIFTFSGEPKLIQVDFDRFLNHKRNIYTTDWKYMDITIEYPSDSGYLIERPKVLDKMLYISRVLSEGIPHLRVDLYCIGNDVYFGELTFYHGSGMENFIPEDFGNEMGAWINLPSKN